MTSEITIRARRVVLPGGVAPAVVVSREGRIFAVRSYESEADVDFGDRVVLPGLVDAHVHINEPGREEWEGFRTAGRAAASGGVTTLVDMPLNSDPVTVSARALERKRVAAEGACDVDFGFWAGLIPEALTELESVREAGALGFKAFLCDSGLPEFPPVGEAELAVAMPRLARMGVPLLVHAEAPGLLAEPGRHARARVEADPSAAGRHEVWKASRPSGAEAEAIDLVADLARKTECRVHIVHAASAEAVERIRAARAAGTPLTAETCPHYLVFDAAAIPDGAVEYKCAPPLRSGRHREALWGALLDGTLDLVATDHSPCPPDMKRGLGFLDAWGGIASLGLALSAVWTHGRSRDVSLPDLAKWLSFEPARLAGLDGSKGAIRPGMDADLAIFDPEAEFEVTPEELRFRHPFTPYLGMRMRGRITHAFSRGRLVYRHAPSGSAPAGPGLEGLPSGRYRGEWVR